uniref:Uncharacterized protein n=1 Tax=Ananas comosus var. bracteatus TaxID=296719 RepID=A0A6V7P4D8_ANACO|nr:unnamed protein product [Ananas comosus var. bracteatus]
MAFGPRAVHVIGAWMVAYQKGMLSYSENTDNLIIIVKDDDVRNIAKLYNSHTILMEIFAIKISNGSEIPACEADEIDEALTNERLEMIINNKFANACSLNRSNVDIIGT